MPFADILLINTATQVTYVPNTRNEYFYMTTFFTLQSACILKHGIKTYWYLFSFSIYVVSKIHSSEPVPALTQTRLQCTFFMLCKWFVNFIAIISLTLACSSFLTTTIVFSSEWNILGLCETSAWPLDLFHSEVILRKVIWLAGGTRPWIRLGACQFL